MSEPEVWHICYFACVVCSSAARHWWMWEEPSPVSWRWMCKQRGQLPVHLPRRTRDRPWWLSLFRWAITSTSSFLLFSGIFVRVCNVLRMAIRMSDVTDWDSRKTERERGALHRLAGFLLMLLMYVWRLLLDRCSDGASVWTIIFKLDLVKLKTTPFY